MFGLIPTHPWHLLFLLVPVGMWWVTLPNAKQHHVTILHNSSLAVSYWEELLFRGLIFGAAASIWHSLWPALIVSSLLFGLFHLRNLWWLSGRQVLVNCLYAGLVFGPIVCLIRWWTGDIYLGIAIHAIHNLIIIRIPTKQRPTNKFLLSKEGNMNSFERLFSGFWLIH